MLNSCIVLKVYFSYAVTLLEIVVLQTVYGNDFAAIEKNIGYRVQAPKRISPPHRRSTVRFAGWAHGAPGPGSLSCARHSSRTESFCGFFGLGVEILSVFPLLFFSFCLVITFIVIVRLRQCDDNNIVRFIIRAHVCSDVHYAKRAAR